MTKLMIFFVIPTKCKSEYNLVENESKAGNRETGLPRKVKKSLVSILQAKDLNPGGRRDKKKCLQAH